MSKVNPIPEGYTTVTPYLFIDGVAKAIEFYKQAFKATEIMRFPGPDGKIYHAEIKIGNSMLMLSDEFPQMKALGPKTLGGSPVTIHLYVDNVDNTFDQALVAGATMVRPLQDQFYGDRTACVADPFGHIWHLGTHIEDVSQEEMEKRMSAMEKSC